MRDLVLLFALSGFIIAIFLRPHVGLLLWSWTAMIIPNTLVFGIAGYIRYNLIFAICTFVSWLISKDTKALPIHTSSVLILIFSLWTLLTSVLSISPNPDEVWWYWNRFIKVMIFCLLVQVLINTRVRIFTMLLSICLGLGYHSVIEGMKFVLTGGGHKVWGPALSAIEDNNHFALAIDMTLPIWFFLYQYSKPKWQRYAFLGALGFSILASLGTFSRGGFIGLLVFFIFFLLQSKRKILISLLSVIVIVVALFTLPEQWFSRMETIQSAEEDSSFMSRVIAWKLSLLLALDHPLIGGGFNAISNTSVWQYYASSFYILDDFISTPYPDLSVGRAAHSIYFQMLGDNGFIGLLIFLLIGYSFWSNTRKVVDICRNNSDLMWALDLAKTLKVCLIVYLITGAALNMAYFDLYFMLYAISASLRLLIEKENTANNTRAVQQEKITTQAN